MPSEQFLKYALRLTEYEWHSLVV